MPPMWWRKIMWLLFAVHYQYPPKPCKHKWEKWGSYTRRNLDTNIVTDEWRVYVCWKCLETKNIVKLGEV